MESEELKRYLMVRMERESNFYNNLQKEYDSVLGMEKIRGMDCVTYYQQLAVFISRKLYNLEWEI
jgi:hypothetical protein